MIFDSLAYSRSLSHIGTPLSLSSLPFPLLVRSIPDSNMYDAVGPWPYSSAPNVKALPDAMQALQKLNLITATIFVRPDQEFSDREMERDLIRVRYLKNHYIRDPSMTAPELGPKTRRNLKIGLKNWHIERIASKEIASVSASLQAELASRRDLSIFASVTANHFSTIADISGIEAVAAVDDIGIGAVLIAARSGNETHLLHLLTAHRVIRTCGTYLLMDSALKLWAKDGPVYLGGAPSSAAGPGIAQFKARWANRTDPVTMIAMTADVASCQSLLGTRKQSIYFPPYRGS